MGGHRCACNNQVHTFSLPWVFWKFRITGVGHVCTEPLDFGSQAILRGGKGASDYSSESLVEFVRPRSLGPVPRISDSLYLIQVLEFSCQKISPKFSEKCHPGLACLKLYHVLLLKYRGRLRAVPHSQLMLSPFRASPTCPAFLAVLWLLTQGPHLE